MASTRINPPRPFVPALTGLLLLPGLLWGCGSTAKNAPLPPTPGQGAFNPAVMPAGAQTQTPTGPGAGMPDSRPPGTPMPGMPAQSPPPPSPPGR